MVEMTEGEQGEMWNKMREALGGPKARLTHGLGRNERRMWEFAYRSRQTVEEFKAANWWAREGFGNRALENLFWPCHMYGHPQVKTREAFIESCKGRFLERFRNIGKITIKQALGTLGLKRLRARCKHCGEYLVDRGGMDQLDIYEITEKD